MCLLYPVLCVGKWLGVSDLSFSLHVFSLKLGKWCIIYITYGYYCRLLNLKEMKLQRKLRYICCAIDPNAKKYDHLSKNLTCTHILWIFPSIVYSSLVVNSFGVIMLNSRKSKEINSYKHYFGLNSSPWIGKSTKVKLQNKKHRFLNSP